MRIYPCKTYSLVIIIILTVLLQGCALHLLNLATPPTGYSRTSDLSYGDLPRQNLDIYEPNDDKTDTSFFANTYDKNVTLVFFYGGAWDSGNKDLYRFVGRAFALEGYRVVIPDYRIYPEVQFPLFVQDSALAIKKIITLYPDQKIVLVGHSAGAHIAALLATNPNYLSDVNVPMNKIKAWIGWSGPYNFLPLTNKRVKRIFSNTKDLSITQPINYISQSVPPTLLIHGEKDTRVIIQNSESMANKLRDYNVHVVEKYYKNNTHSNTLISASTLFREISPSFKDTISYLNSQAYQ
ncbi:MAG: alpha/beta hydrolase [Cellvibrionaceae bacterium]